MKKINKLKISITLISGIILTSLVLYGNNIYLELFINNYEERHYDKLNKESNLGSLKIESFPKQKILPEKGLVEITFSEFVELVNNKEVFKDSHFGYFVADEVTYREMENTRFFKKEDFRGIYLTDNNKELFRSFEIFNKNERRDLYEIIKEDEIFFYEKIDEDYLGIKNIKNQSISISYKRELLHESFINHDRSMKKYIKGFKQSLNFI